MPKQKMNILQILAILLLPHLPSNLALAHDNDETSQAEVFPIAASERGESGVQSCILRRGGIIFHLSAHGSNGPRKCSAAGGVIIGNLCAEPSILRGCEE